MGHAQRKVVLGFSPINNPASRNQSCRFATFSVPYSRWATRYSVSGDLPWIVTGSGRRLDSAVGEALCRKLIAVPLQAGYGLRARDHKGESQHHVTSHHSRSGPAYSPLPKRGEWAYALQNFCGHYTATSGCCWVDSAFRYAPGRCHLSMSLGVCPPHAVHLGSKGDHTTLSLPFLS